MGKKQEKPEATSVNSLTVRGNGGIVRGLKKRERPGGRSRSKQYSKRRWVEKCAHCDKVHHLLLTRHRYITGIVWEENETNTQEPGEPRSSSIPLCGTSVHACEFLSHLFLTADVERLSGGGRTRISSGSLCPAKIKATEYDRDGGRGWNVPGTTQEVAGETWWSSLPVRTQTTYLGVPDRSVIWLFIVQI